MTKAVKVVCHGREIHFDSEVVARAPTESSKEAERENLLRGQLQLYFQNLQANKRITAHEVVIVKCGHPPMVVEVC